LADEVCGKHLAQDGRLGDPLAMDVLLCWVTQKDLQEAHMTRLIPEEFWTSWNAMEILNINLMMWFIH